MENNNLESQPTDQNQETIFSPDEFSLKGYDKHIRQARNAIFAVAILLTLSLVILCFTSADGYDYLWVDILLWGAFIAGFVILGFWTKKKPYTAIITAICLYAVSIGLNALLDVTTLYKGLIFKVIVIVLLFKGLGDAKEAQALQKNFDK